MKIKPLRATYPDFSRVESPELFCDEAKNLYENYVAEKVYQKVPQAAFYIYQIQSPTGKHTGLVGLNEVEDFFVGKVKKHEDTLSEKEKQQVELFLRWNAILKPVLLTYPPVDEINAWLQDFTAHHKHLFDARFKKGKVLHRIWAVTDPQDISTLQKLFSTHVKSSYIADGHHRTSTIALLHEQREQYPGYDFDHLFCAFFAIDQLDILDYNRVAEMPKKMSGSQLMARLSKVFNIEPLPEMHRPQDKHELVMCFRKEWYSLHWRPEILSGLDEQNALLDASLLNEKVLGDIFEFRNVRSDTRISYVDGSKGMTGLQKAANTRSKVGFALYPVHFEDMMFLADAGEILPPKSTYFEPRLKSGVLVQLLREE